jgi:hypothetical protein
MDAAEITVGNLVDKKVAYAYKSIVAYAINYELIRATVNRRPRLKGRRR